MFAIPSSSFGRFTLCKTTLIKFKDSSGNTCHTFQLTIYLFFDLDFTSHRDYLTHFEPSQW